MLLSMMSVAGAVLEKLTSSFQEVLTGQRYNPYQ